jgi:hypothetical protein
MILHQSKIFTLVMCSLLIGCNNNSSDTNDRSKDIRDKWKHTGGQFMPTKDGTWLEIAGDGTHKFREVTRTHDAIELQDLDRPIKVWLYADRCEVAVGGGAKRSLYTGEWETTFVSPNALASASPAIHVWTSDPALQSQLASEQTINGFAYRPPQGYTPTPRDSGGKTRFMAWQDKPRADKSVAKFTVLAGPLNANDQKLPLVGAASVLLKADQQKFTNVVPGPASSGTINGIPFYKTSFTMEEPGTSFKGRATVYHGHLGDEYIHLVLLDVEPHVAETEKILEAAALSVRPKP